MRRRDLPFGFLDLVHAVDKRRYLQPLLAPHRDHFARLEFDLDALDDSPETDRALLRVLTDDAAPLPAVLAEALYEIADLAHEPGHDRIREAAETLGVPLRMDGDVTPAELAVATYLSHRDVFRRALDGSVFARTKLYQEYQAIRDRQLALPSRAVLDLVEDALRPWFREHGRGEACEVEAYREPHGVRFSISHGRTLRHERTYEGRERRRVTLRPQKQDSVLYDNRTCILHVNARTETEREIYRTTWGSVLFGDARHFPGGNRYTLQALQERGAAALVLDGVPGVLRARWVEAWVDYRNAERHFAKHKSDNLAITFLRRGMEELRGGTLVRVVFSLKYARGRARRLEVRPPNVAIYDRERDVEASERFLEMNALVLPGDLRTGPTEDARWNGVAGDRRDGVDGPREVLA